MTDITIRPGQVLVQNKNLRKMQFWSEFSGKRKKRRRGISLLSLLVHEVQDPGPQFEELRSSQIPFLSNAIIRGPAVFSCFGFSTLNIRQPRDDHVGQESGPRRPLMRFSRPPLHDAGECGLILNRGCSAPDCPAVWYKRGVPFTAAIQIPWIPLRGNTQEWSV
jgi:hypothetical protein